MSAVRNEFGPLTSDRSAAISAATLMQSRPDTAAEKLSPSAMAVKTATWKLSQSGISIRSDAREVRTDVDAIQPEPVMTLCQ